MDLSFVHNGAESITAGEDKVIESNPVSIIVEELLPKRVVGELQKSESVRALEKAAIEKIPPIPLTLEHQDLKINMLDPKVKSTS